MIRNFLKTAIRNFLRNRFYTAINVFGLSIGISVAILIFSIIKFEISYDSQFDSKNIYRILTGEMGYGEFEYDTGVPNPFTAAFREEFPEAKYVTIVDSNFRDPIFSVESSGADRYFEEPVYVDPDFFKIFNLEWIFGSSDRALPNKNSTVITESIAIKYFGTTDVLGETIIRNGEDLLSITGVVKDFPANTSFDFNIFLPFSSKFAEPNNNWSSTSSSTQTFFTLNEGVNPDDVEFRLLDFFFKYKKKTEENASTQLKLQKMNDIHFDNDLFSYTRTADIKSVYALGLIGIFIVLTACINFINLNTVQVVKRSKEIGIRKVMGSGRGSLIAQFLSETAMITVLSIVISFGIVELSLINLDKLLGYSLEFGSWLQLDNIIFITTLFLVVTILSGWYPSLVLSSFHPSQALKKKLSNSSRSGLGLRRTLVIVQFVITQVLIVCTIIVARQINYFTNTPMGFEKDQVIEVNLYQHDQESRKVFKDMLLQESIVQSVSYSNTSASSGNVWSGGFRYYEGEEEIREDAQVKWVDSDFATTYGLEIVAGEDLLPSDTTTRFLVNEEFVKAVGAKSPQDVIGNFLNMWGDNAPVMGVVKDFFAGSMHAEMTPVVIGIRPQYALAGIRITTRDYQAALQKIEGIYEEVFPQSIFKYNFLDERIAEYYEDEQRDASLLTTFSMLSVIIGGLGLLGLISFMAQQRVKEVGIRKVFGASISHLLTLFTKEFVVLIIIAFLFATPLSYYAMSAWLADYPYKIEINIWVFVLACLFSIVIAVLTVGYKSYSAATANPVDVLRDE